MALSEDEIRPHRFDQGKLDALNRDLEWLRARKDNFVLVACPACDSGESSPAFEKFGFHFRSCARCRTAYMSPRAAPDLLQEFYARSELYEFWNEFIFPASRKVRQEKIFRPRVRRIVELCNLHGVPRGTIVDVGAATGAFCEEARDSGAFERVVGVEPGRALAETCRNLGIETYEAGIESVEGLDGTADIVTSFETIEHVFSPREFLAKSSRLLRNNGLLVITCPNFLGFDIQTLGVKSESLDAEHINMFNPASIEQLVGSMGFRVLECVTPGELDAELVRSGALLGAIDLSGQPFLKMLLIDEWNRLGSSFQAFLRENRLSSHMWVVAQRVS